MTTQAASHAMVRNLIPRAILSIPSSPALTTRIGLYAPRLAGIPFCRTIRPINVAASDSYGSAYPMMTDGLTLGLVIGVVALKAGVTRHPPLAAAGGSESEPA